MSTPSPSLSTADLVDEHPDVQILRPGFQSFGRTTVFHGLVDTVHIFEDNVRMRDRLSEPGNGRVLVVDAGGSDWCAVLGDRMAQRAIDNDWMGIVINGYVRDSEALGEMDVGVLALGTCPRRSRKNGDGATSVPVTFGGCLIEPGCYLYADHDGVIIANEPLLPHDN